MKKKLLFMAMALFSLTTVAYAQEDGEGGEEVTPQTVFTKSLLSIIEDAKFIVADSHYTTGQADLQTAISAAEEAVPTLGDNESVRQTIITLQTAIDQFVYANGHVDATEKIQNPSFDKDNNNATTITGWTTKNMKQNRRSVSYGTTRSAEDPDMAYAITNFVEQWANTSVGNINGTGDISQVVKGLPAGHYRLTADILVINQRTEGVTEDATGIQLYANDVVREIGLTDQGSGTNAAAFSVDFDVKEGEEPTIGLRFESVNFNWMGWDNVTLYFIGDPEVYNSIVNAEKLAAAKETLATAIASANEALASEDAPFYRNELTDAITAANALAEAATLEDVTTAIETVNEALNAFNNYNKHYTNLKATIESAEALVASGEMTEGVTQFQEAINAAKTQMAQAATAYASDAEGGAAMTDAVLEDLKKAESTFRILNASYAHPANVITNGSMSSTAGWEILEEGANPNLHINTSGTVTNFSKPFMECWVNNTNYGKQNYARQTVNALPDGLELPSGYYVLKAAALATRQDQADLQVSGVTLKLQDEEVAVHTANGVANIYRIGYDKKEAGGELTFGLFIDESTDANWIAWDEVELQFVGDKDKYMADYTKAVLGESLDELKATVDNAWKALADADLESIDFEHTELYDYLDGGQWMIDNPTDPEINKEGIELQISLINDAIDNFFTTSGVSPKAGKYFNFTSMIKNADFDVKAGEEWTVEVENGVLPDYTDCAGWWFGGSTGLNLVQDFSQTVSGLPAGNYLLDVNAAIRVDMTYSTAGYTAENLPNNLTSCYVYANELTADVHPFFYEDEAKGLTLEKMMEMTNDWDYRHGNGTLLDYMLKQSGYFNSYIPFNLDDKGDVKIGFHVELPKLGGQMPFVDYFHLYYFGKQEASVETLTGIATVADNSAAKAPAGVYNLKGQLVSNSSSVKGLAKGLYIIGGKKVIVR